MHSGTSVFSLFAMKSPSGEHFNKETSYAQWYAGNNKILCTNSIYKNKYLHIPVSNNKSNIINLKRPLKYIFGL